MVRAIDWKRLLGQRGVEYVEHGPNVKRGNINVHCPFCGSSDPSHHLGINLESGFWGCWRNADHRGRSPVRLLVGLLGISRAQAYAMANEEERPYLDDFSTRMEQMFLPIGHDPKHTRRLELPKEFRQIVNHGGPRRFFNYMMSRGFRKQDVEALCSKYGVYCAIEGDFRQRVIFTIKLEKELMSWTGRAIGDATVRYKALSNEKAVASTDRLLYNFDHAAEGGDVLVVTEGPVDVLKLDFYGQGLGLRSVGLMTKSITEDQTYLLHDLSKRFTTTHLLLDADDPNNTFDAMRMAMKMGIDVTPIEIPFEGVKDAGDLRPSEIKLWAAELTGKTTQRSA